MTTELPHQLEMTIKNYRCFRDSRPVHLTIRPGFTAFVGMNNAGKSALLRFFYEFRKLFQLVGIDGHVAAILGGNRAQGDGRPPADSFSKANDRPLSIYFHLPTLEERELVNSFEVLFPRNDNSINGEVRVCGSSDPIRFDSAAGDTPNVQQGRLRSGTLKDRALDLRPIQEAITSLSSSLYIPAFRNAIGTTGKGEYFDLRVGRGFVEQWNQYKAGTLSQNNEAIAQLTEDIRRVLGFTSLEIYASNDQSTLKLLIDRKSYRLDEVGAGIAQFIIVLMNVAMRRPDYILLDEPELNLHPALQLDFLTTLGSYANRGVLFATHSLGLARAASDLIYSVTSSTTEGSAVHIYESTPNLPELLGALSFAGYQELGFDRVLLVEGPTDVRTVQQLLRIYHKEHQVVILPLGGSALINEHSEPQLQEVLRIAPHVEALIDSEKSTRNGELGDQRAKFSKLCVRLSIKCHVTQRRSIENYLTDEAIRKVKGSKYKALEPYQRLEDLDVHWAKHENWRIAREMSKDDLSATDLGDFLEML